jgi:polar amino acid transport system substrate-binding protein
VRKLISVIMFAAMLALASLGNAQGVLRVGSTTAGYPVSGFNGQTHKWEGIAVELLAAVAKDAHLEIEFQPLVFAQLQPALLERKIDIIAAGYGITPAREKIVGFTAPYWTVRDVLVVPVEDTKAYKSHADFKGMSIVTPKGSAYVAGLQDAGAKVTLADSPPLVLAELEAGRVAGAVDNGLQVAYRLRENAHPKLKIVDTYTPFQVTKVAFAVRKGDNDLLARLNASLAKLQADGTVRSIAAKWHLN